MAGIGEADGGIGDRALPSFRADLFLDDAVSDLRIHTRFETGYRRIDNFHVFYDWNRARPRLTIIDPRLSVSVCRSAPHFGINSKLIPEISISV